MLPTSAAHRGIIPAPIRRFFSPLRSFQFLIPRLAGACIAVILLADCAPPKTTAPDISIFVVADGTRQTLTVPGGTTVAGALDRAGLSLGDLDRVTPPLYSLLADGATIRLIRVRESFTVEDVEVPFEKQVVRNEAMPADETRILQTGKNGSEEITYRIVTEDGVEISRSPLKTSILVEPVPEVLMTGTTASFLAIPIGGALTYVDAGNAWLLTNDTNNRLLLTAAGDLDSRVFSLSPDAVWLLCSRNLDGAINSLAAIPTTGMAASPVTFPVTNIVHFADWSPVEPRTIAYSTVQPVTTAPGWQANNDLRIISFDEKGTPSKETVLLGPQSAGSYSWWGSGFAWSPDGTRLAYTRPDEIGWINRKDGIRHILLAITPFRTLADWVWLPPAAFTPDGAFLLTLLHGEPVGLELPEASPVFDLAAIPVSGGQPIILAERTGMFASPIAGPQIKIDGGQGYNVAFLQALRPLESDRSTYRLMVADRDGSNLRALFPPEGETGLDPQQIRWAPDAGQIAAVYKGNLWIVDLATGTGQQITSDGQVTAVDWK